MYKDSVKREIMFSDIWRNKGVIFVWAIMTLIILQKGLIFVEAQAWVSLAKAK